MAFHSGADRLEHDIVEAAKFVAARWVALGRFTVPGHALFKIRDHIEEALCRFGIAHFLQHIGLGADQLVGFGQVGTTAIADDFACNPRGQWVAGDTGKRIRTSALQSDAQLG